MKEILWKDIQIGDKLLDGSKVTQIHGIHKINCIKLKTKNEELIISEDHLILCDISKVRRKFKKIILDECVGKIPLEVDQIIFSPNLLSKDEEEKVIKDLMTGNLDEKYEVQELIVKDESKINDIKKGLVWLTALEIHRLMNIKAGIISSNGNRIISTEFVGEKEAFCISTDTGRYITSGKILDNCVEKMGVVHHNSVTIRNIIFHCLTHGIKIGMVDLKITEFESYKNCRDVIGVANNVEEAVELLRIARSLMYKRNGELAKAGVVDLVDFKPTKKTDRIAVFGREFKDTDKLTIREDGNEREITFGELETILKG